jgi:hypothetical protein
MSSDEQLIQASRDSLGIAIQTQSLTLKFAELSIDTPNMQAREFIDVVIGFLIVIGVNDGLYLKTKKQGVVEICANYPFPENPTKEDILNAMTASSNSIEISRGKLSINSLGYTDPSGESIEDAFMKRFELIPEDAQQTVVVGILNAVSKELNEVLDG